MPIINEAPPIDSYTDLLNKLYHTNLFGGMKLGLTNIFRLSSLLGDPHHAFDSIHIAGSNGKGSVATKIAAGLAKSYEKVGLFTSPHISSFRERIRINSEMIKEDAVRKILTDIFAAAQTLCLHPTFFEVTTLLALMHFAKEKVQIAVIETGLGGRLDATNIITPILSVITSLSLEHTHILGNSLAMIAREKAGIIKDGVPVVLGPTIAHFLIEEYATQKKAPLILTPPPKNSFDYNDENTATAVTALKTLGLTEEKTIIAASKTAACRFEIFDSTSCQELSRWPLAAFVILDTAHNEDSTKKLIMKLRGHYKDTAVRYVVAFSKGKEFKNSINQLANDGVHLHLCQANTPRAQNPHLLQQALDKGRASQSTTSIEETPTTALKNALDTANKNRQGVVVCGTFFMMGEVRTFLGFCEPKDPRELNEISINNSFR